MHKKKTDLRTRYLGSAPLTSTVRIVRTRLRSTRCRAKIVRRRRRNSTLLSIATCCFPGVLAFPWAAQLASPLLPFCFFAASISVGVLSRRTVLKPCLRSSSSNPLRPPKKSPKAKSFKRTRAASCPRSTYQHVMMLISLPHPRRSRPELRVPHQIAEFADW